MSGIDTIARGLAAQSRSRLGATQARLQWWARSYRGAGDPYPAMAAPPTVTMGTTNGSTINASNAFAAISVPATDPRWEAHGVIRQAVVSNKIQWNNATLTDGTQPYGAVARFRFLTDAPAFEVPIFGAYGTLVNAIVDGAYVSRSNGALPQSDNSGNPRYLKFDFGADAGTFYVSQATKVAGGAGYALNDMVTVDGGTFTRPAKLRVAQLTSGGVALFSVEDGGAYSVVPTGTPTTTALSGAGSGATAGSLVWSKTTTTRKLRSIELILSTAQFYGINFTAQDSLVAWPPSARVPRLLWVGDSQSAGTYLGFPGGHMAFNVAQRIGLMDNIVLSAQGGTGWVTANGTSAAWSNPYRVADYIAASPDVIVFDGSQNDGTGSNAAVTTAVASVLGQLQQALPTVRIVLIGPVVNAAGSYLAALAAGVALAPDRSRVRLIDNQAEGWTGGSGRVTATTGSGNLDFYMSSDNAHLTQAGTEFRAAIEARRIGAALVGMIG